MHQLQALSFESSLHMFKAFSNAPCILCANMRKHTSTDSDSKCIVFLVNRTPVCYTIIINMHMLSTHPTFLELVHVQLTAVLIEPSQTVHKGISIRIH